MNNATDCEETSNGSNYTCTCAPGKPDCTLKLQAPSKRVGDQPESVTVPSKVYITVLGHRTSAFGFVGSVVE